MPSCSVSNYAFKHKLRGISRWMLMFTDSNVRAPLSVYKRGIFVLLFLGETGAWDLEVATTLQDCTYDRDGHTCSLKSSKPAARRRRRDAVDDSAP